MAELAPRDIRDRFAAQQAQLAAQQARIAALEARLSRRRGPRAGRAPAFLAALLVALVPLSTLAVTPFTDLDPAQNAGHNPNIEAIYAAGITRGCNPPANDNYCPKELVTREQMATFLARTAGLGGNPPIANARTAQRAATAGDAATLGGYAPAALARVARAVGPNRADTAPERDTTPLAITMTIGATPLPPALQPVLPVTIDAPAAGFVLVSGALYVQSFGPFAWVRLRHAATGTVSPALVCGATASSVACSPAPVFVFPVGPGEQTIILEAAKSGSGNASAYDATLVALFVPFGAGGGAALDLP